MYIILVWFSRDIGLKYRFNSKDKLRKKLCNFSVSVFRNKLRFYLRIFFKKGFELLVSYTVNGLITVVGNKYSLQILYLSENLYYPLSNN